MDTNHQLAELDAVLINGFDPIAPADIVTAADETVLLDKAIHCLDLGVDPSGRFDELFGKAHSSAKPIPIRSAPSPASGASSVTDEQLDKALDAADAVEDNGELSAMTRWFANQIWHGKSAGELLAWAHQGDPSRAELMHKAAANLNLVAADNGFEQQANDNGELHKNSGERKKLVVMRWFKGQLALGKSAQELIDHAKAHDLGTANLLGEIAAELGVAA